MAGQWFICGKSSDQALLEIVVRQLFGAHSAVFMSDPYVLRAVVRTAQKQKPYVLVSDTDEMSALSIAGALLDDAHAESVAVAHHNPSLAYQKRAQLLGIKKVVDLGKLDLPAHDASGAQVKGDNTCLPSENACARTEDHSGAQVSNAHSAEASPIIVISSARGGVGKSAIASMMAQAAASWDIQTALVDLDLKYGNLFSFYGLAEPADLAAVLMGGSVEQSGVALAKNLTLFGSCKQAEHAPAVAQNADTLLKEIASLYKLVIVDAPASWHDEVICAARLAQRLMLVVDERSSGVGSLVRCTKYATQCGIARTKIIRVVNRCCPKRRDEAFMERAKITFSTTNILRILDGGADVDALYGYGRACELFDLDESFGRSCAGAMAKILSELGCLPQCSAAERALAFDPYKKPSLFSLVFKEAS